MCFFTQLETGNSNCSGNWHGMSRWSGGSSSLLVNFARNEFARPVHIHPLWSSPEFLMTRSLWPAYRLETGRSFIYNAVKRINMYPSGVLQPCSHAFVEKLFLERRAWQEIWGKGMETIGTTNHCRWNTNSYREYSNIPRLKISATLQ